MSNINDVVNVLKAKVDELALFVSELHDQADAAHADALSARSDLALVQLENHDLRNQLQLAITTQPVAEYDPAVDLQSVIDHLDVLMGRGAAPAIVEPVVIPSFIVEGSTADLVIDAPVDHHAGEVVPLEIPPLIVEDSPVEPAVDAPVEPTLTLVTPEPVVVDSAER